MKTALSIAVIIALGASPVLAKATHCQDPTTHKRISCKVAPATAAPAKAVAAAPAAKPAKHSLFGKKPATTPMAASAAPAAKPTAMAASGLTAAGKPHKGIKCGNSYIAANKVCHKG